MSVHLQRAIEQLKTSLLALCGLVEDQVQRAVLAILNRDMEAVHLVEERDRQIDQREVEIEEECLKMLALYQPAAGDLRFIVSALKINNDLERIGDLAVNLAHKARTFAQCPQMEIPFDLRAMWSNVQIMLRDSVNAMVRQDSQLAHEVCGRDHQIDQQKRQIRLAAEELIEKHPDQTRPLLALAAAARNLERIADHATNIAEDVIYMCEGRIARHSPPSL